MRRILIIILIIGLALLGVWGYKTYIQKSTEPLTPDDGGFKSFFPLGNTSEVPDSIDGQLPNIPSTPESPLEAVSKFKQLTSRAVAGFTIYPDRITTTIPPTTPKGKPTTEVHIEHVLRYVSRGNGYVYEIREKDGAVSLPIQISNIFIPNIYEALFMDNGKSAILRFLREDDRTIATYTVPVPELNPDNTRTQKEGKYLPDNILNAAISPNTTFIARITKDQNMGVLTFTDSQNSKKTELLQSSFTEWIPLWPSQETTYVQTKASAAAPGFLYLIDSNKRLKKVIGDIAGLTTSVSPSGTYVIYSESTGSGFTTKLYNTKTASVTALNLSILPEKCTWLINEDLVCAGNIAVPTGLYPDIWYAGVASLSDSLYRISTKSNTYEILYNGDERSFDMTNIRVDEDRNIAFFINKQTGILWQYSF